MPTIELPPPLPEVPEPDACVAAATAGGPSALAATLRAAAVATADVATAVADDGLPGDWQGATADTAGVAFAEFHDRTDAGSVALETAVRGLDVYDHQVTAAAGRWDRLDGDRRTLNADITDLRSRIDAAGESADAGDAAAVAGFRAEADRLARRRETLVGELDALAEDVEGYEDRLVRVLAGVDTEAEADTAADDPGRVDTDRLLDQLRRISDDPDAVHAWWEGLTPAERAALTVSDPGVVGGTNGIPTGDRDVANRSSLQQDLDYLHGLRELGVDLTTAQQRALEHAQEVQNALDEGAAAIDPSTQQPVDTNLLLYDPDAFGGDGAGAVSYGDPDTADNTVVMVPGLTSDLSSIGGLGEDALHVLQQAGPGESTAVIGWIGYDAPNISPGDLPGGLLNVPSEVLDVAGVGTEAQAEAGGHQLVDLVDGLRATDEGDQSNLTVIGHSYGSTTVAHAGADGLDEDAMVLLGSPGAGGGVDDASDLGAPELFVGSADNDPVTWLGGDTRLGLGPDPAQDDFGGTRIGVDPGEPFDGLDGLVHTGFEQNHTAYYDPGSESLDNIGRIVTGDPPPTTEPGRDQPARQYLADWTEQQVEATVRHHVVDPVVEHVVVPVAETAVGIYDTGHDAVEWGLDTGEDALDGLVSLGGSLIP